MNRTIGTATPNESTNDFAELRVFDNSNERIFTFLNSTITEYTVEDTVWKITLAELELSIPEAFPVESLAPGTIIEVWHSEVGSAPERLFRGALDYAETISDTGEPIRVALQAREIAAAIVDTPFKGELGPSLADVVSGIVESSGLQPSVSYPELEVSAWVNVQSSYGVLRLLATNFDAVVHTRDGVVGFISKDAYLQRTKAKPSIQITRDQIQSARIIQGRPVRK